MQANVNNNKYGMRPFLEHANTSVTPQRFYWWPDNGIDLPIRLLPQCQQWPCGCFCGCRSYCTHSSEHTIVKWQKRDEVSSLHHIWPKMIQINYRFMPLTWKGAARWFDQRPSAKTAIKLTGVTQSSSTATIAWRNETERAKSGAECERNKSEIGITWIGKSNSSRCGPMVGAMTMHTRRKTEAPSDCLSLVSVASERNLQ